MRVSKGFNRFLVLNAPRRLFVPAFGGSDLKNIVVFGIGGINVLIAVVGLRMSGLICQGDSFIR